MFRSQEETGDKRGLSCTWITRDVETRKEREIWAAGSGADQGRKDTVKASAVQPGHLCGSPTRK